MSRTYSNDRDGSNRSLYEQPSISELENRVLPARVAHYDRKWGLRTSPNFGNTRLTGLHVPVKRYRLLALEVSIHVEKLSCRYLES